MKTSYLPWSSVRRSMLVLVSLAVLCAVALDAPRASASDGSTPDLDDFVLKAAQVGSGYKLEQRPDGRGVRGLVTLDLCGFSFPSEDLRTGRLQVDYVHAGNAVALSNEVVTYRKGGAQQALQEVAYAATHCPRGPIESTAQGVPSLTYRITQITDERLLPGSVALLINVAGTYRRKHVEETVVAVYQRRGHVLSGVYAHGNTLSARRRMALRAAEQSAENLKPFLTLLLNAP